MLSAINFSLQFLGFIVHPPEAICFVLFENSINPVSYYHSGKLSTFTKCLLHFFICRFGEVAGFSVEELYRLN